MIQFLCIPLGWFEGYVVIMVDFSAPAGSGIYRSSAAAYVLPVRATSMEQRHPPLVRVVTFHVIDAYGIIPLTLLGLLGQG